MQQGKSSLAPQGTLNLPLIPPRRLQEMAPRSGQMAAAADGKLYVFGGYADSTMWREAKEDFQS